MSNFNTTASGFSTDQNRSTAAELEAPPFNTQTNHPVHDLVELAGLLADAYPGEVDMAGSILTDLHRSTQLLAPYTDRDKVVIFGSARITSASPVYEAVRDMAARFATEGYVVITGGGPGAMSAGLEGAGPGNAVGISVDLPFESPASFPDIPVITQRRFFTRKLAMVRRTRGVVVVPGGFGTLDELFEVLTLLQTGKKSPAPVVLLDDDGFWDPLLAFVDRLVERGMIAPPDRALLSVATTPQEAVDRVHSFWKNFRGFSGVDGVGRISLATPPGDLAALAETFPVFAPFTFDPDSSTLSITFDRRNFGLLHQLVDALNREVH